MIVVNLETGIQYVVVSEYNWGGADYVEIHRIDKCYKERFALNKADFDKKYSSNIKTIRKYKLKKLIV